jgi:DNA-binding MarR family transcriptional regulator
MVQAVAPSTGHLVWRLAVKWRAELDRALAPSGLTSAQYSVLAALSAHTAMGSMPSQRELADFVGLEPMFVSKLARALQRMALVERHSNPSDPRALQLQVTAKGTEVAAAARSVVAELERRRLSALGGAGGALVKTFNAALQTLLHGAESAHA